MKPYFTILAGLALTLTVASVLPQKASAGWWGGGASPKPAPRAAPQPKAEIPKDQQRPDWKSADADAISSAASDKKPIVIFFRGSLDKFDDDYFLDADVAQVSKDTALFIRVDKKSVLATTNSVKKDAVVSPLPVERVKATDLRAAYNITIDGTFLVCDCFGNEFSRMTSKPTGKQVLDALKKVPDSMAAASKKVQAEVDKADAALKIDDLKKAMPALFNAFKLDKVGYEPCAKAQELYASAIEKGRAKLKEYQETSNKDGMKALAESFKKTELEKEIADAQASVVTGDKKVSAVETKKTE